MNEIDVKVFFENELYELTVEYEKPSRGSYDDPPDHFMLSAWEFTDGTSESEQTKLNSNERFVDALTDLTYEAYCDAMEGCYNEYDTRIEDK